MAAVVEHRVSGADTGFIYVSTDSRVGFCPANSMRRANIDPTDQRICVWVAKGWDQPTAYQLKQAVDALRREYPSRGIVIDTEEGLVEV